MYPIARGTGVALTAVLSGPLLGESISGLGALGVSLVVLGVMLVGAGSIAEFLRRRCRHGAAPVVEMSDAMVVGAAAAAPAESSEAPAADAAHADAPMQRPSAAEWCTALGRGTSSSTAAVLLALVTGVLISAYSLVDKLGVTSVSPVSYIALISVAQAACMTPAMFVWKRRELLDTPRTKKRYAAVVGVGVIGTYLVVLFALQLASVGYVVALRELSVVVGAVIGFVIFKEQATAQTIFGIVCICSGQITIKFA